MLFDSCYGWCSGGWKLLCSNQRLRAVTHYLWEKDFQDFLSFCKQEPTAFVPGQGLTNFGAISLETTFGQLVPKNNENNIKDKDTGECIGTLYVTETGWQTNTRLFIESLPLFQIIFQTMSVEWMAFPCEVRDGPGWPASWEAGLRASAWRQQDSGYCSSISNSWLSSLSGILILSDLHAS